MLTNSMLTLLPFAFVASFTPGPTNILVMSRGVNEGLRATLAYQAGAGFACFLILFVCILFGVRLEQTLPALVSGVKYVGGAYMLWLAWLTARAQPPAAGDAGAPATLTTGFVLQFVNPKYYLYVLTLAAVLAPATHSTTDIALCAFVFSLIAVIGMFIWAAAGALLQHVFLRWRRWVNAFLGLTLVWSAWEILKTG